MSSPLTVKPRAHKKHTRPMLIFISDIHLTDELGQPPVPWGTTFERFWARVETARGELPAELCIIGDFIDIVRSPSWLRGPHRPYHDPKNPGVQATIDTIVAATIAREKSFFDAIRSKVQAGKLKIHYVLGNHDRLMGHAPNARRALWTAMTGEDRDVEFPREIVFADHDAVATHGHTGDFICSTRDGSAPISDMFGLELIVRFPDALRAELGHDLPHLDDIDDVRPLYAVPAWIRQIGHGKKRLMGPVAKVWTNLVEEFLEVEDVKVWMKSQKRVAGIDPGPRLQSLLHLSTGRIMAHAADKRLSKLFGLFQGVFDGAFQERAIYKLEHPDYKGLRYVLNGHSHFSSMTPLGTVNGKPTCYFNSGTWRTVHRIGTHASGRPTFMPMHSMCYIVFFPGDEPMGRDFEWWQGAMVAQEPEPQH